ncbi:MAG TPA: hypothetical protein PLJ27_14775 [Polyangiaceae bacterium]|jgi:hypothetical protein|nr:MAG: hypothetical protein BWY17_01348 [Deltaproteobacteria bacterium ADurb.Bin207]HQK18720.1 hypothetical protein [Polyangiaceae bacterium]
MALLDWVNQALNDPEVVVVRALCAVAVLVTASCRLDESLSDDSKGMVDNSGSADECGWWEARFEGFCAPKQVAMPGGVVD